VILDGITEAKIAEAIACREGLALACDLMLRSIRLASHSANVIKSIEGTGRSVWSSCEGEVKGRARELFYVILLMRIESPMMLII
jgi:hypothetical protein